MRNELMVKGFNPQSAILNSQLVRAVLFDAVGTLIYPSPPVAEVYQAAGRRHGIDLSRTRIGSRFASAMSRHTLDGGTTNPQRERERWQAIVADVLHELPSAGGALFEELWQHFARPTAWALFDDAPAACQALAARGLLWGVASNFDDRLVEVCRGLPLLIDAPLFWSSKLGFQKPHPEFFAAIAQQLSLPAGEILLVGDDIAADFYGAQAAGWQAVLLTRDKPTPRPAGVPAIENLGQLEELLAASSA